MNEEYKENDIDLSQTHAATKTAQPNYKNLTLDELRKLCTKHGIPFVKETRKHELIMHLEDHNKSCI